MADPLRVGFVKALVAAAALILGLAGVIALANHGHHRPEGIAERWLSAVSDTTRKGVRADATARAEKIGPLSLAAPLLPAASTGGKAAFADLEVGKAHRAATGGEPGSGVAVPFQLHQHVEQGTAPIKSGTVALVRSGDSWRVTAVSLVAGKADVPSNGGAPPSRAPVVLWPIALLAGVGVTLACSAVVRAAGPGAVAPGG